MPLGDAWAAGTTGSTTLLNNKTITYGTGTYLDTLDKTKHKIVVCTATSGTLIVDHVYCANAAGTAWIDITATAAHTHSGSTQGGDLVDMFVANPKFMDLNLTTVPELAKSAWYQEISGTGTIADDFDGTTAEQSTKLLTGTTSGSGSTITSISLKLDFSKTSIFQFKARLSATTALAMHNGVDADVVTAADSNAIKYNAEVCTATNTNWFLRSADGSANSTSDSGTAFTTNRVGIRIEHYPTAGTPRLDMYIGTGSVFQKTTNIPTTGASSNATLIRHSLKNSAGADKNAFIYGSRLRYMVLDDWA